MVAKESRSLAENLTSIRRQKQDQFAEADCFEETEEST